jgi:type II secretory pathway predicted ATPase ExeA
MSVSSYEAFFGLLERPFSLTPDTKYFYKSRTHGRAIEMLTFGLRRREQFLAVTGDFGIGKTTLCRMLAEQLRRRVLVALVPRPLLGANEFLRLVLRQFAGGDGSFDTRRLDEGAPDLVHAIAEALAGHEAIGDGAVVIVDDAHTMPALVAEQVNALAAIAIGDRKPLQFVLASQPSANEATALSALPASLVATGGRGSTSFDERAATRLRLLALVRADCSEYIAHRLAVAGGTAVNFSPRAMDVVFELSGGVPRLVNLLCERALQEAAAEGSLRIDPPMVEGAAAALELLRARAKRFRWFAHRRPVA